MKGDALGHRPSGAVTVGCTSEKRRSTDSPCSRRAPSKSRGPARKCTLQQKNWDEAFFSPRPQTSRHSSPHGRRGSFNHCAGDGKARLASPRICYLKPWIQPQKRGVRPSSNSPSPKVSPPLETSSDALAMRAISASTPQAERRATGSSPRSCHLRQILARALGSKRYLSHKQQPRQRQGPNGRPAQKPGVQACRVAAATARTPQRPTGCPGSPPPQPRENFQAMPFCSFLKGM